MPLSELFPSMLWRHFATICSFPHGSGQETALRDQIKSWAEARGLAARLDAAGNLILSKPATAGCENRVGVILQAHLDMVCQKNQGNPHDFLADPIVPVVENGWVHAQGTTLGADNGIGVAAALAALESSDIAHGPLEVLLTLDEEAGMTGARALETGDLHGKLLFNLDTEDWGELYVGCAGGLDMTVHRHVVREAISAAFVQRKISISGLVGGHSGCDIHLQRANAIRLLARLLQDIRKQTDLRLVKMNGGTVRNALPREAFAVVAVPACDANILDLLAQVTQDQFRMEYAGVDESIRVEVSEGGNGSMLRAADTQTVIDLLLALPYGVRRWNHAMPDVVETSNNIGVVNLNGEFETILMVRSLTDAGCNELAAAIEACSRLGGAQVARGNAYPGWNPDLYSRALKVAQTVYREQYGEEAKVKVIHAGLECGLIGDKYPRLEMVSFGPTIRNAHSPAEKVEIESVGKFWEFLKACLKAVPVAA
ncbi:dipeptidase D [Formivibrio citricus]|uniref:Cytosol non-specific dipeptidase n=1 Tax=Formivibrio citricus TaxID=83765 RepID=A0A1I5B5Z7_9NEIS|nr:aminoacyl-histidine dipeptidase [Formivibrio citricus]SFN70136.1 dipeptidase D [Formivibrio citricus]